MRGVAGTAQGSFERSACMPAHAGQLYPEHRRVHTSQIKTLIHSDVSFRMPPEDDSERGRRPASEGGTCDEFGFRIAEEYVEAYKKVIIC